MRAVQEANQSAGVSAESESRTDGASPIQVCLFGGLTVLKQGRPVRWRGGTKTEAMLLSLALDARRGVPRERLLTQLWPGSELALANQSLNSLIHGLHRMLGDEISGAPPVVHSGEIYRLNVEAGIAVDITTFEELARRGDRYWGAGDYSAARDCYQQAVDLYRGDLHAGIDLSVLAERERLRNSYLVMVGRLADIACRDNDYSSAVECASLVLRHDACREDAHRLLMRCYAQLGQRVPALRQYLLCERLLREGLDAVPEPATRALFDRLRLDPGGVLEER
jgi:DNA-binding SARP family transcriptional activator